MKLIRTQIPWPGPISVMDDWFGRALGGGVGLSRLHRPVEPADTRPRLAADVFEDDHNYYLRVEMPGAKKEDVAVRFEDDVLHVSYQKREEGNEARVALSRSFRLPGPLAVDGITAKLEDGILMVTLPRSEAAKPRGIVVE